MRNIHDTDTDILFEAILNLKNIDECRRFFDDLCTIQEIRAMTQRIEVAMLLRDKLTYHEIAEKTGASTATISRINRCLMYGANGYEIILNRINNTSKETDND